VNGWAKLWRACGAFAATVFPPPLRLNRSGV